MSLINEALKRTKNVQQHTPSAAEGPTLRPVEPNPASSGGGAKTLLLVMVLAVIVGNFLLWMAFKDRAVQHAAARAPATAPHPDVSAAPGAQSAPAPAAASTSPVPAPTPAASEPPAVQVTAEAPPQTNAATAAEPGPAAPEEDVIFTEPARPTVLRLQSIIYGTRPSAMIGGKFLFIGDRIQGHEVIAINKETVTLVGEGRTNVLTLP